MRNSLRAREYQRYLLNIMALYRQRPDLKAYLELLLSLITVGMFIIFAIKPTLVTIGDLITKINAEQETSDQLGTKIKNLGLAQNLYTQNFEKINLLAQAVPTNPDIGGYIRQVEGGIKKENLDAINITVGEFALSASTESGAIKVTSIASGGYTGLTSFIKDLESLRRPAFIEKLDLLSIVNQESKTLNITIVTKVPYTQSQ